MLAYTLWTCLECIKSNKTSKQRILVQSKLIECDLICDRNFVRQRYPDSTGPLLTGKYTKQTRISLDRIWITIFYLLLLLLFWPHHAARRILVPRPGTEPVPPAVEAQTLNHWTTREVPGSLYFKSSQEILISKYLCKPSVVTLLKGTIY